VVAEGRPVVACLAVLGDKDIAAMVSALAPAIDRVVCTELDPSALAARGLPGASSHSAANLARACEAAGLLVEEEPELASALGRARKLAGAASGMLLVTGSHYVLAPTREALLLWQD
jgi:folylpolyglutamate synthase/dihydropteroate synthase